MYKKLVLLTTLLAFGVVVLGAYVRLSDAGLGCPDWPGCYGRISPHHASDEIAQAVAVLPNGPVSTHKAWKEMTHRYFAGTLGLLIAIIAVWAWRKRGVLTQSPVLPVVLVGLVMFQALLGMWTVTERLKPFIVSAHLLGGMMTLALLVWLAMHQLSGVNRVDLTQAGGLRGWAGLGLLLVFSQIALGGWVSSNYAALACAGFPQCNGVWWPEMDFSHAFRLARELGMTADGAFLSREGLTAIHWVHRLGAYLILLYTGWLAFRVMRIRSMRGVAWIVVALLITQIVLGICNVLLRLPLPVAVAHNGVAALLLGAMVVLNFRLSLGRE
ncbi:cytochrome C oxidase assembly protein, AA3 subunit-controlling protein [Sulfuricella denitrificans skB26]|uniref:Cytochrome C oxidase assembly protein, AA3 subunit-controlling protein n=1 Tax=Sulfuricella denitrificans (strain DSM 22764 / NBRC 105220 / skB26) TaxID=1163617 RepID=S6ADG6_SULDS|nr:cytochrome C oxidase assembly protein, AA3 subunit-controlling protein [Sulfuricella denitrificans skB26]